MTIRFRRNHYECSKDCKLIIYKLLLICFFCTLSKQVERRAQSNVAASYDIQASPTLSRRPPMKSTSDMFQIMEERK